MYIKGEVVCLGLYSVKQPQSRTFNVNYLIWLVCGLYPFSRSSHYNHGCIIS